jgi:hypothetical protein
MTDDTTDPIPDETTEADAQPDAQLEPETPDEPEDSETFTRSYVEKLRREAARYRERSTDRDEIAHRLHLALVTETGRLADPTDLPYADEHLADPDALTAAIDALLTAKPHLARRTVTGNIGQGATNTTDTVSLAGLLRRNAS